MTTIKKHGQEEKIQLMVVDDETAGLHATAMLLEIEGFEVLTAASESEALECVSKRTPDLLITDYQQRIIPRLKSAGQFMNCRPRPLYCCNYNV